MSEEICEQRERPGNEALFSFQLCAHGDGAGRGHGIELDELGFLDGINFQHRAVSKDGVMHPCAGRKRVGQRRFI